jgi:hypothetical protein
MAGAAFLKQHREWEDWAGIGLGILIGLTPWLAGELQSEVVTLNATLIGVLVLALAAFEFVDLRRWEEVAELACGAWLAASPLVLGYAWAGQLRFWHFALGAVVAVLAVLELWQDWRLGPKELAKHGQ